MSVVDGLGVGSARWCCGALSPGCAFRRHTSTGTPLSNPAVSGTLSSSGARSLCLDCAQISANPPQNAPITSNTASLEILENLGGVWR